MIERTLIADDAQGKLKPEGMYTRPRLPSMVMKSDGLELPLRGNCLRCSKGR